MTGLKAKAIAAFEEDVKRKKAVAVVHFKGDFGIGPDETGYLGDYRFLFRSGDLYVQGYIEFIGDHLYGKSYQLTAPCPLCRGWIVAEKSFFDLPGLGEAIVGQRSMNTVCDNCARTSAD